MPTRLLSEIVSAGEASFLNEYQEPLLLITSPPPTPKVEGSSTGQFQTLRNALPLSEPMFSSSEVFLAPLKRKAGAMGSTVWVGRDGSCDVVIPNSLVSKAHCGIQQQGDATYVITDLGSTNGTRVDGAQLKANHPAPLTLGSEICLGELRLQFVSPRDAFRTLQAARTSALKSA